MLKRLTVHLDNVKTDKVETGYDSKKGRPIYKSILTNTISIHNIRSEAEIKQALSTIRNNHTIATFSKSSNSTWKHGQEMWYTSNETL